MKAGLFYLNELVEDYNNTYHYSISKMHVDASYSTLYEKTKLSN